uniref:Uncharacterized protein n=1 Tax=Anopheles dirus TaxID=7168 RepID=A0A182NVV7_9DIPT
MQFVVRFAHLTSFWVLLRLQFLLLSAAPLISPEALSPDDTLFAHLRCFELFASKQSTDRARDAAEWLGCSEHYLHQTERTPPFVRCVLTRLRFYDAQNERFNVSVIASQYGVYKRWITLDMEEIESFINDTSRVEKLDGSRDEAIYDAFAALFHSHSNAFFQLFLRDTSVLQNMYDDKTISVRKPNQTMVQFCELQMSVELWTDICLLRVYEISNHTQAMERHITCIFRGFHYLDADGFIDVNEITFDYEHTGSLSEDTKDNIQQCATNSSRYYPIPKRSLAMYRCLLTGSEREAFKEAFDFREIRSGNQMFTIENLPYDRVDVKQQIQALDKQHCNDRRHPTGMPTLD